MFEGTLIEYITAFGGGSITLHLVKTLADNRKGRLAKKQLEARALELSNARASGYLNRGRLWEAVAHRLHILAIRSGAPTSDVQNFPPSMDSPYPEAETRLTDTH